MIPVSRTNTILYCEPWSETVVFYRDLLRLPVSVESEWFVEFEVAPGSFVSVADAARASIAPGDGRGITLSWQVADVGRASRALSAGGVDVGPARRRFGCPVVDLFDPAGNRIELWSDPPDPGGARP